MSDENAERLELRNDVRENGRSNRDSIVRTGPSSKLKEQDKRGLLERILHCIKDAHLIENDKGARCSKPKNF